MSATRKHSASGPFHLRRQHLGIAAAVFRADQIVHGHADAVARIEQAIDARRQHALETTVAIQQSALAVADHDLLEPEHDDTPFDYSGFDPGQMNQGRRIDTADDLCRVQSPLPFGINKRLSR
jgi:hypothetical protein